MNAYDRSYERIKAVQKSAELLRDLGTAFFPLDVLWALSAFGKQINLVQYADLKKSAETKASDSDIPEVTPQMMSKDGFCTRVPNFLFDTGISGSVWYIYYDDSIRESRIRFTLMHELGHIVLRHHQLLHADTLIGLDDNPEYSVADKQADLFSINILAPAPAVFRLLNDHGFSYVPGKVDWQLTNPDAPFLQNLGNKPNPEVLLMTAFGLSQAAANRRLRELPAELELWNQLDPALYAFAESIPHRAGWFCWVCHTRGRTTSRYCPGCGHGFHYEFQDPGAFSRPVMGLRKNGQFEFCSVCGTLTFQKMLFIVQSVEVQWSMNARMHPIQMGILFAAEWKSSAERIAADLRISIADHVVCSQNLASSMALRKTTGSLHGQVIGAAP